jgi:glycosyltransferase involved in cell wall biosynthesis
MPRVFADADIAVLPSDYNEGVPRVLLEAAASGLPLVATDIEGCRVIVRDGVNGFLVPTRDAFALADAIERLAADAELRERMGAESARIAAAEFDERLIIAQWMEYYRALESESDDTVKGTRND